MKNAIVTLAVGATSTGVIQALGEIPLDDVLQIIIQIIVAIVTLIKLLKPNKPTESKKKTQIN